MRCGSSREFARTLLGTIYLFAGDRSVAPGAAISIKDPLVTAAAQGLGDRISTSILKSFPSSVAKMIRHVDATYGTTRGRRGGTDPPSDADALFARMAAQAGIGAWTYDLAGDALGWTPGVYHLFGLSPADRPDRRDTVALYEEESRETMERLRARAISQARAFTMEAQIIRSDGEARWMRLSADVAVENGRARRLFGLKQDITDEKKRWDALRKRAECDALTGLANRAVYETVFLNAPYRQPAVAPLGALVLFDLDGFKQVNDRHGHAAGDACLRVAAERIGSAFADAPLVARIGGDEFAVLVGAGYSALALERRVTRLLNDLGRPIAWRGRHLVIGASAGVAPADDPYRYDAEALFSIADEALYAAKTAGRGVMIRGSAAGLAFA